MINKEIILYGGTGQAKVVYPELKKKGYSIVGVIDDTPNLKKTFRDVPLYQGMSDFVQYSGLVREELEYLITIGNNSSGKNGLARKVLAEELKDFGFKPHSFVHHKSFIDSNVSLGEGIQVMASSTIIEGVRIGDYCIINTGASVDHECEISSYSEISPNATLCGEIKIGKNVWIGANATILPKLTIGKNSIVGAGSVVTKDIEDNAIYVGNPARLLRRRLIK